MSYFVVVEGVQFSTDKSTHLAGSYTDCSSSMELGQVWWEGIAAPQQQGWVVDRAQTTVSAAPPFVLSLHIPEGMHCVHKGTSYM